MPSHRCAGLIHKAGGSIIQIPATGMKPIRHLIMQPIWQPLSKNWNLDLPIHPVGNSYGACTGLFLALHHPERVRSLVLSEPPVFSLLEQNEEFKPEIPKIYSASILMPITRL